MARPVRVAPGGLFYRPLNRAVVRLPLFQKDSDYQAVERVLALAWQKHPRGNDARTTWIGSGCPPKEERRENGYLGYFRTADEAETSMAKIQGSQLKDMTFQGKTVFMVHLKQEKQYWKGIVPATVEVRTSHSLGFRAIRRAYHLNATSVNELKVSYILDRLIHDEPDTATQRERLMQLMRSFFQRHDDREAAPLQGELVAGSGQAPGSPGYRDVVITLTTLAKKQACTPHDIPALDAVLEWFTPYYHVFRTNLDNLDRKSVLAYVDHALEKSLPIEGVLEEYDFADQIWLPAIFEDMPLEWVDTLLVEENPGFCEAEKRLVDRWQRNGATILEVVPEPPPKMMGGGKTAETAK